MFLTPENDVFFEKSELKQEATRDSDYESSVCIKHEKCEI